MAARTLRRRARRGQSTDAAGSTQGATLGEKIRLPRGAIRRLADTDEAFAAVIESVGRFEMRKKRSRNGFEALVRAIVYQQLSGKAAATIYGRVVELHGGALEPAAVLKTHHARLRKAGLSRQKQAALRDLCRHVLSGRLPLSSTEKLSDDELIERLTEVRGIGRWSAQMFLMFHLGRLDVWPEDDLGVRKAVARLRGLSELPGRRQMPALGERFAPYRTVASWYLWRSLDGAGGVL